MNGRAYDYHLGRFLSVDPVVQAPGNSQSLNPYAYIMNNPLSGTDPTGYTSKPNLKNLKEGIESKTTSTYVPPRTGTRIGGGRVKTTVVTQGDKALVSSTNGKRAVFTVGTNVKGGKGDFSQGAKGLSLKERSALASGLTAGGATSRSTTEGSPLGKTDRAFGQVAKQFVRSGTSASGSSPGAMASEQKERTWGSYLPGTKAGDNAAQYWADIAVGSDHPLAPLAHVPGVFAALWTDKTAVNTAFTLGTAGLSSFPNLGSKLGSKLFLSESFGITSTRFAHSVTGVTGSLNVTGGLFKLGWSSVSRNGGGMMFRFGLGGTGNAARFHFYMPGSFVPNSFANGSIQVKRALHKMGQ